MNFNEVFSFLTEGFEQALVYIQSPGKRTYYIYLLTSLALALYVYLKSKRKESFFKYIFNREVWLSKSAFTDYGLILFNGFVKITLIAPFLIFGLQLAFHTDDFLLRMFHYPEKSLTPWQTIIFYTITLSLVNDFATYLIHLLFHKVPFLWEFHKIHHSATSMNPFTQYRLHPVELICNNIKSILIFGLVTGLFDYLSDHQVSKWTYLGVNAFSFAFYAFGANLRHSHVKLSYFNFLEYIFISPVQHQVHHSDDPKHYDKNLGSRLAIWDWLFGTLVRSKEIGKITFGLGVKDNKNYDNFIKNLYMPFWNFVKRFR